MLRGVAGPASLRTEKSQVGWVRRFSLFMAHMLEAGHNIRTLRELLGHHELNTTMIYTHVTAVGSKGVRSPLDHRVLPPISQGNPIGQNSPSSRSLGRRDRD